MRLKPATVYHAILAVESLALLTICSLGLMKFFNDEVIRWTCILAIYTNVYLLYFSFSSLYQADPFQFIISVVAHIFLAMFNTWHFISGTLGSPFGVYLLVAMCITLTTQMIYFALMPSIIKHFHYKLLERVGAEEELITIYQVAHAYFALLKIDLFLELLLVLLASLYLFNGINDMECLLNILSFSVSVFWRQIGTIFVKQEYTRGMIVWLLFGLLAPTYIIYKFVQLATNPYYTEYPTTTYLQFYVVGGIALAVKVAIYILVIMVIRNFDHGLAYVWYDTSLEKKQKKKQEEAEFVHLMLQQARERALLQQAQAQSQPPASPYGNDIYKSTHDYRKQLLAP